METAGGESLDFIAGAFGTRRELGETDAHLRARITGRMSNEVFLPNGDIVQYYILPPPQGRCSICNRWRELNYAGAGIRAGQFCEECA